VVALQAVARGWLARRSTARQRRQELEFLGMLPPADSQRSAALQQRLAAIAGERKARQAQRQAELDVATISIKAGLRQREGFGMKEAIRDKVCQRGCVAALTAPGCCGKSWQGPLPPSDALFPRGLPTRLTCTSLPPTNVCPLQLDGWFLSSRNPESGEYADLPEAAKGGSRAIIYPPPPQPTPEEAASAAAKAAKAGSGSGKASSSSSRGKAAQPEASRVSQAFVEGLREAVQQYLDVWQEHQETDPTMALRKGPLCCWHQRRVLGLGGWHPSGPPTPQLLRCITAGVAGHDLAWQADGSALLPLRSDCHVHPPGLLCSAAQCRLSCRGCPSRGAAAAPSALMKRWRRLRWA
jgi:hypothetical protein